MKSRSIAVAMFLVSSAAVADIINVPAGGDIQAAIDSASDGDVIQLEIGSYQPMATIDTLGKAVTLRGWTSSTGGARTILEGQGSIGVLQCVSGEGEDTVFESLFITGGSRENGGGMFCHQSSPRLENCTFEGNSASALGGGMFNVESSPTLSSCMFSSNVARHGGGMANTGSNPILEACWFVGNSAIAGFSPATGGGMYNTSNSSPTLTSCVFDSNSATSATEGTGGGMHNRFSSSPTIVACTFASNSASLYGGGMYSHVVKGVPASSPAVSFSKLCGNTPTQIYGTWSDEGGNTVASVCATGFDPCLPGTIEITQNSEFNLVNGGVACQNSGISYDNLYARSYDLSLGETAGATVELTCVEYGINNTGSEVPSVVSVYLDTNGGAPEAPGVDLKLLGERVTIGVAGVYGIQRASFDPPICISADSTIVVTLFLKESIDGFAAFAGNDAPQSGPTYILSESCGLTTFADLADMGFPEWHWVQVLVGKMDCEPTACPADFNGDGEVTGADMGLLLSAWMTDAADLNHDGTTDGADMGLLLAAWGPCS